MAYHPPWAGFSRSHVESQILAYIVGPRIFLTSFPMESSRPRSGRPGQGLTPHDSSPHSQPNILDSKPGPQAVLWVDESLPQGPDGERRVHRFGGSHSTYHGNERPRKGQTAVDLESWLPSSCESHLLSPRQRGWRDIWFYIRGHGEIVACMALAGPWLP